MGGLFRCPSLAATSPVANHMRINSTCLMQRPQLFCFLAVNLYQLHAVVAFSSGTLRGILSRNTHKVISSFTSLKCTAIQPRPAVSILVSQPLATLQGESGTRRKRYLIVQRGKPPSYEKWSFPGGKINAGETILEAASRELAEEAKLSHSRISFFPRAITSSNAIVKDNFGKLLSHFVISQMYCWAEPDAVPSPGDDAVDCKWVTLEDLIAMEDTGQTVGDLQGVLRWAHTLEMMGILDKKFSAKQPM
ncbi:hypothetical protein IE077_000713 [Cardiosporidium cionae]|uniref:Nudix hydrolase domain-containing protein n=1 Tax=Cardiosporidium cionae TaxID=476202 RepID=A0ABQ7JF25_9APIC|nr:hypothetical protein IE077_000713 [Cardiosporidium cionae]|eukprot:KAF8822250.1 hypothetical protein IE077_000713 [Cardiosporidium cionae]